MKPKPVTYPAKGLPKDLKVHEVLEAWQEAQTHIEVSLPPTHPAYGLFGSGELHGMTPPVPHRRRHRIPKEPTE